MFEKLPENARIWVFGLERPPSEPSAGRFLSAVREFIGGWKAHGHPVRAEAELSDGAFLVVAADPNVSEVSGCSIDQMFRTVSKLASDSELALADFDKVFYASSSEVRCVSRPELKELVRSGKIQRDTPVFDTTVDSLESFRSAFRLPLERSWHAKITSA